MTTELVRLTDDNPLKDSVREDGTWSARTVLDTGLLHQGAQAWNNWNSRILAAKAETELLFGVSAGQINFAVSSKNAKVGFGERPVPDWSLTAFGLMYSVLKSDLPETNAWFVFAGMEKMFGQSERKIPSSWVQANTVRQADAISRRGYEFAAYDPATRCILLKPAFKTTFAGQMLELLDQVVEHDTAAEQYNAELDRRDYGGGRWQRLIGDRLRLVLGSRKVG